VFGPKKGRVWYCLDYSQLQLRIFAYVAGEKQLIQAFEDGYDAHTYMAMRIFNKDADDITKLERRIAKNVNFGFIFGASPSKIELTAGVPGLWDTVIRMFPSAHRLMESTKKQVYRTGYVTTPHGYRLYLPEKYGKVAAHAGVNYIIQGCEGDIVKNAMINCYKHIRMLQEMYMFDGYMSFQVHDELIFDFPRDIDLSDVDCSGMGGHVILNLKALMEKPGSDIGMVTPVDVEYTITNWADTHQWSMDSEGYTRRTKAI
jgi:DNA polymerase-1